MSGRVHKCFKTGEYYIWLEKQYKLNEKMDE